MKKTIVLGLAMTLATFGAFAQESKTAAAPKGKPTAEERAKRQADKINETAQLSADQYNKVLAITKDFATQREALRSSGAQGDDFAAKRKAIEQKEEAQLKTVLTPAQMEKVRAAMKENKENRKAK